MCYGSLNAWILFGGKLSQTAANENMFPEIFGKTNKAGSPSISLWIAAIGTIGILAVLEFTTYKDALSNFLDMSVIMYVVLYLMAIISYLAWIYKSKKYSILKLIVAILAFIFCLLMLKWSNFSDFTAVVLVLLASLPIFIYWNKRRNII